jgi:uncharacterized protein (DUF1499 family)
MTITTTTKEITTMIEPIDTPSVTTIGTPTEVLVSVLLTIKQADILRDIMDFMRDDTIPENVEFADDLYIALNRSEEWTA